MVPSEAVPEKVEGRKGYWEIMLVAGAVVIGGGGRKNKKISVAAYG